MKTFISTILATLLFLSWAPAASAHAHEHSTEQSQSYSCPMHPEVTGSQGDSCPKCGMDLTATKTVGHNCDTCPNKGKGAHHKMNAATHDCPMHPAVKGKKGDSCPECGMDLTPIAASDGADKKSHMHH
ncbi:heavy metal-binding domain-containing protein [Shewanella youngdeokensis]|uniref:Heavy metal-binding domain-containing protein n=1 Tax=Shewanella youngdeokensis TaxID=2999068 RepID=A0ABZ0JYQ2_9GAMM|nr:heavy metal-binding domain-containing protein [Shewanella sp. DAU334]